MTETLLNLLTFIICAGLMFLPIALTAKILEWLFDDDNDEEED